VMITTRHALFLPLDRAEKYEGKTTIDTFFWRFGDMVQAGAFYIGLEVFGMTMIQFAAVNMVLAVIWIVLAVQIGRQYRHLVRTKVLNVAPEVNKPIPDVHVTAGKRLDHVLAHDTFIDKDPGDVMTYTAQLANGGPLPGWLLFDALHQRFSGKVPVNINDNMEIEVVATDFEGLSASTTFFVYPQPPGGESQG